MNRLAEDLMFKNVGQLAGLACGRALAVAAGRDPCGEN